MSSLDRWSTRIVMAMRARCIAWEGKNGVVGARKCTQSMHMRGGIEMVMGPGIYPDVVWRPGVERGPQGGMP